MTDVLVPDMGSDDPVDIAEILVKVGDSVALEDSLVVLESAKASLEVPSPSAGIIAAIHVAAGQSINTGELLLTLTENTEVSSKSEVAPNTAKTEPGDIQSAPMLDVSKENTTQEHTLPDIGGETADIIELSVQVGAKVKKDQTLLVLESAKATVEVPAETDGVLVEYLVKVGDSVKEGMPYVVLMSTSEKNVKALSSKAPSQNSTAASDQANAQKQPPVKQEKTPLTATATQAQSQESVHAQGLEVNISSQVHAGPAVRRLANKLGVALGQVSSTGPRGRILKEDIHNYVKMQMLTSQSTKIDARLAPLPTLDFNQYGEIEEIPLTKIQSMSATNLHRAWVNIPHVTQFDEADITELDAFRKSLGDEYKAKGIKITMLAFMIKASTLALKAFPRFNASLHADGKTLIQKKYCHIGFAADTPFGLVVPVIRNADQLSVAYIAEQLSTLSGKARDKKLKPQDMQGGCFSISSLGGIGGTAFTPIVNWPEVSILGVSRASIQPRWNGKEFAPRLILPLSLSYDHRVIDGADAARFAQYLVKLLSDAKRMLL